MASGFANGLRAGFVVSGQLLYHARRRGEDFFWSVLPFNGIICQHKRKTISKYSVVWSPSHTATNVGFTLRGSQVTKGSIDNTARRRQYIKSWRCLSPQTVLGNGACYHHLSGQRCVLSLSDRRTLARSKGVGAAVTINIGAQSFWR